MLYAILVVLVLNLAVLFWGIHRISESLKDLRRDQWTYYDDLVEVVKDTRITDRELERFINDVIQYEKSPQ